MIMKYSKQTDGDKNISAHFKIKEFACKDGSDTIYIDDNLVEVLESLRMHICQPVSILSGYRTQKYNEKVDGAKNSYHVKGQAADIYVQGIRPAKLAIYAAMQGARGIIVYKDFVHVDTREERYVGFNV